VLSRITGAFVRGVLVMILIAIPSVMVPGISADTAQIVALVALFAAGLTFFEYASTYPGLVEFRDAPPFNRLRYLSLLITVVLLSMIVRDHSHPTVLGSFVTALGEKLGASIDVPYSPIRLVLLVLPSDVDQAHVDLVRTAAGIAYMVSLLTLVAFVLAMRFIGWPSRMGTFNVWINLPTFDPTTGGDVVDRLTRDSRVNIVLGFLLPFAIPVMMKIASLSLTPVTLENPHTLIWTMAAWAFLPASLFMRGIAMGRVANMIAEKRKSMAHGEDAAFQPA
jgi:hypothetical protein